MGGAWDGRQILVCCGAGHLDQKTWMYSFRTVSSTVRLTTLGILCFHCRCCCFHCWMTYDSSFQIFFLLLLLQSSLGLSLELWETISRGIEQPLLEWDIPPFFNHQRERPSRVADCFTRFFDTEEDPQALQKEFS